MTKSAQIVERSGHTAATVPPKRARRRSSGLAWLLLLLWVVILAGAGASYFGVRQLIKGDLILPGVQSLGQNLGGLTTAQAERMLQNAWAERTVVLEAGGESWTLPADKVGLRLDTAATARAAHRLGRNTADSAKTTEAAFQLGAYALQHVPALRNLIAPLDPRLGGVQEIAVDPVTIFDRRQAADTVRLLAQQLEIAPQDASISVEGGQVVTTPAVSGRALNLTTSVAALEANAGRLADNETLNLSLPVVPLEPTLTDVSSVVQEVAPLLSAAVTLNLWDPVRDERITWDVSPQDTGRWIVFEPSATAPGEIAWRVDDERVGGYLDAQEETLGPDRYVDRQVAIPTLIDAFLTRKPTVTARIQHFDRTHEVTAGETISSIGEDYGIPYPWILKSNPELGDTLAVGQEIIVPSPDALLPLTPVENKRIKVSIGKQHMQAFENGELKFDWVVSTGLPDSPTSPGVFQIQTHEENAYANQWDLYMPYFMGIYRPGPDGQVMNGFHGFPSRDRKQLLWTKNLGRPVTYGCILLSTENAKTLFDWADEGVIVEVSK